MKSSDIITDKLSAWREIQNAADLAHGTFDQLDTEEIQRLALRAYTEEWRAALRRKDANGVPIYTSILAPDETGELRRIYKQTALFDVEDYEVAIDFYQREAKANQRVAQALAADCFRRHGVQLSIDGLAS